MKLVASIYQACFCVGVIVIGLSIALTAPLAADEALQISWNFENGNLGSWSVDETGDVHLLHGENSGNLWFYFRVETEPGTKHTFVFDRVRKDFFGEPNLPVVSYDQKHWFLISDRVFQPHEEDTNAVRYSFSHTFAKKRAWIAFSPPFTNTLLNQEITVIESHPHANVLSLYETPIHKQTLPVVHITDPDSENAKKTVLVLSREDSFESSGSWFALGMIRFLLSEDPVSASIRRRCHFLIIPVFDRDGVASGDIVHPMPEGEGSVFWTETWSERNYSFFEQRQLKHFLQTWKDQGHSIDIAVRLHSDAWKNNFVRAEHCSKENEPAQMAFFEDLLTNKYLPWFVQSKRLEMDTRFSKFVVDLFPHAMTGLICTELVYTQFSESFPTIYKTTEDGMQEGELFIRAIGEHVGIQGSNPQPYLHNAHFISCVAREGESIPVQCIYRDLLNRAPTRVAVIVNEKSYPLEKVGDSEAYSRGILYSGFIPAEKGENTFYFQAENGDASVRIPKTGAWVGPFVPPTGK